MAGLRPAEYNRIRAPRTEFRQNHTRFRAPVLGACEAAGVQSQRHDALALDRRSDPALPLPGPRFASRRATGRREETTTVYIVDEALVVREMRKFLLGL